MISNSLLDKANKVLGHTVKTLSQIVGQEETEGHVSTVEKDTEYPKFTKKSKIPKVTAGTIVPDSKVTPGTVDIDTSDKSRIWTDKELKILVDNIHLNDDGLAELIPTRSKAAISFKKRTMALQKKRKSYPSIRKISSKSSIWTIAELEALRLNMHMKPKQLQTLSWLKRKTRSQISQKKYELTTRVKLKKGKEKIESEERRLEQDEN